MKKTLLAVAVAASGFLVVNGANASTKNPPVVRGESPARAELGRYINRINTLDDNPEVAKVGVAAVSKETGVSVARLEEQLRDYHTGTGGLLVCNEMAKATGKHVSTFLKARKENRGWEHIADEYKFDLSTVLPKLERVQQAMEKAHAQLKKK